MIYGRFGDTSGRPYIPARVVFPRLKALVVTPPPGEADVSFLADTGADITMLMPADWSRFSVSMSKLTDEMTIFGVGGPAKAYREQAIITFSDSEGLLRVYEVEVVIAEPNGHIMQTPSLLGRDIMKQWAISFDKKNNRCVGKVHFADHNIKLKGSASVPPLSGVLPAPVML